MLKVRYFALRGESNEVSLTTITRNAYTLLHPGFSVVSTSKRDLVLLFQTTRQIKTVSLLEDGSELTQEHPTIDRYRMRFIETDDHRLFLSVLDPPRSSRLISHIIETLLPDTQVFYEAVVFRGDIVERHIRQFDAAKLVSAKIKNFHVYDNTVGRLEVSARTGLHPEIAPFLEGKYYEVDSLTYEVVVDLVKGLVTYSSSGTVRVSDPIIEKVFTRLESHL